MAEQIKPNITEWSDDLNGRVWTNAFDSSKDDTGKFTYNENSTLVKRLMQVFDDANKTASQQSDNTNYVLKNFITFTRAYINAKADRNPGSKILSDFAFSDSFIADEKNKDHYWNESIIALVEKFNEAMDMSHVEDPGEETDPEKLFLKRYRELLNANAGFSFLTKPYVKPDINIDGQTYEEVRGVDSIESVLRNNKNMQYTHTQEQKNGVDIGKYIRLLMPKYSRRVEVEDLNRNFWVIGQTIGTISAYLLDPDSALNLILKSIISEIAELWNNVFELWHEVGELWGEIIYLWLKIGDIEDQINELAKASAKTVVNFNMNMMGSNQAPEWLNVFQEPVDGYRQNDYEVEWIYFLGEKNPDFDWKDDVNDQTNGNGHPKVNMKSKVIESYKGKTDNGIVDPGFINEIPWLKKYFKDGLTSSNGTGDDWVPEKARKIDHDKDYCVNWSEVDGVGSLQSGGDTCTDGVQAPYIGFLVKYKKIPKATNKAEIHYAAYDYEHPYIVLSDNLFGPYRYTNTIVGNQTYMTINRIIYEEVFKKHLEVGPTVNKIGDFITIERDKYNTRPMGEILEDLMGLNIILKDISKSDLSFNHFSTIGIMPRKIKAEKFVGLFLQYFSDVITDTSFNSESEFSGVPYLESQALKVISDKFNESNDYSSETLQSLSYYWNVFKQIFKGVMKVDKTNIKLENYDSNIGHLQSSVVNNKIAINDNNIEDYKELLEIILGHFGIRFLDYLKESGVDSLPAKTADGSPDFDFENGYKTWASGKANTIINGTNGIKEMMNKNALYSCSTPPVLFEYNDGWAKKNNVSLIKDDNDIMYGMAKYLNSKGENNNNNTWMKDELFKDGFTNGAMTWRPWEVIFTGMDTHNFYCLPEEENDLVLGSVCRCVETIENNQKKYYMGYQGFYDYMYEKGNPTRAPKFTDTTTDPKKVTSSISHVIYYLRDLLNSALVDNEKDPVEKQDYIRTCGDINKLEDRIDSTNNKIDLNTALVKIKKFDNSNTDERSRQFINSLLSYFILSGSLPATNLFKATSIRSSHIQPFKNAAGYWINFINESNGSGYRSMSYCSANFRNFTSYSSPEDLRIGGAMSIDDNFMYNSSVSFLLQNCSSDHKVKNGTNSFTNPDSKLHANEVPIQSEISKVVRFNDFLGYNFPPLDPYKKETTQKWTDGQNDETKLGDNSQSIYSMLGKGYRGLKGIELLHKSGNGTTENGEFDSKDFAWGAYDFWFGTKSGLGIYQDKIYLKPSDYQSLLTNLDANGNGSDGYYHISILSLGKFFKELRNKFDELSKTGSSLTWAPPLYGACMGTNKRLHHDIVFRETLNNVKGKEDYIRNLTFNDFVKFRNYSARLQLDFSKSKSTSSPTYTVNLGVLEPPDNARIRDSYAADVKRAYKNDSTDGTWTSPSKS